MEENIFIIFPTKQRQKKSLHRRTPAPPHRRTSQRQPFFFFPTELTKLS